MIYDCDEFTHRWYRENMGVTQNPVKLAKARPTVIYQPIPPYNGYGTLEDSLGSVYSLQPVYPKIDMKKMFKQDMHTLRFEASLVSTEPDDETRKFMITFYCGNDTVQIYEICDKNSGRIGGRFMERQKQINPTTNNYYTEKDFMIGNIVFLAGFKFRIVKADEYTEKYMEDNSEVFPQASLDHLIEKIKRGASKHKSLQDYAVYLMKTLDANNNGFVELEEFSQGLAKMNIYITKHEEHLFLKRFDQNGDGKVSMEEFYNTLAKYF